MKIVIGLGNMGAAILEAVAKTGPHGLLLSDHNQEKLAILADRFQEKLTNQGRCQPGPGHLSGPQASLGGAGPVKLGSIHC